MESIERNEATMHILINQRKISGHYWSKKRFYGLADKPTIFQEIIDRTIGYHTPTWLDDKIVVTRENKRGLQKKLFDVFNKIEKAGCWISKKEIGIFHESGKMAGTWDRWKRDQIERRKSDSHIETEVTGNYGRTKIVSQSETINGTIPTKTFGTNLSAEKTVEKTEKIGEKNNKKTSEK